MIGPQMNNRIEMVLAPSRSTDAGITAITGVLRSGRLAAGSRRLSRTTTSLTATSTPLVKRGRNTDQARLASSAGRLNCPVKRGGSSIAWRWGEKYGSVTGRSTPRSERPNVATRYSAGGAGSDCRSAKMHAAAISACSSRYWTRRDVCSRRRSRPGNSGCASSASFTAVSSLAEPPRTPPRPGYGPRACGRCS